jgi:hypothetical protein
MSAKKMITLRVLECLCRLKEIALRVLEVIALRVLEVVCLVAKIECIKGARVGLS